MTYLIFTSNLTVFINFRRLIFTDLISGTFRMDLFLTLFKMGLFGAAYGWMGAKRPASIKSVTYILQ